MRFTGIPPAIIIIINKYVQRTNNCETLECIGGYKVNRNFVEKSMHTEGDNFLQQTTANYSTTHLLFTFILRRNVTFTVHT